MSIIAENSSVDGISPWKPIYLLCAGITSDLEGYSTLGRISKWETGKAVEKNYYMYVLLEGLNLFLLKSNPKLPLGLGPEAMILISSSNHGY